MKIRISIIITSILLVTTMGCNMPKLTKSQKESTQQGTSNKQARSNKEKTTKEDHDMENGQLVATINGVPVYSTKRMTGIVNTRVNFADGRWCDVASGEIVNKGAGDISCGSTSASGKNEKKITIGPKVFHASTLSIQNVRADIDIQVGNDEKMTLTIEGPRSVVEDIDAQAHSGTLAIQGEELNNGSGTTIVTNNNSVSIGGSYSNVIIASSGSMSTNDTRILLKVPRGSATRIAGVQGKVNIGDIEGSLTANISGAGNIKAGKMLDSTLAVMGSGDIQVDSVTGNLSITVQGSGDVEVSDGAVNALSINLMGSGDARFDGEATTANLSAMGSGDIRVRRCKEKPTMSKMGSGDIRVNNWRE